MQANRIIQLHLLRGLACLLVAVDHMFFSTPLFNIGAFGVGIFFLISGFVVPISLNSVSPTRFLIRRCFRIYPVAIVSTLFVVLFSLYVKDIYINYPNLTLPKMNLWYFTTTVTQIWDIFNHPYFRPIFWTLVIEEKFYWLMALSYVILGKQKLINNVSLVAVLLILSCLLTPLTNSYYDHFITHNAMFIIYIMIGTIFYLYYNNIIDSKTHIKYCLGLFSLFVLILVIYPQIKLPFIYTNITHILYNTPNYIKFSWESSYITSYTAALIIFTALYGAKSILLKLPFYIFRPLSFFASISFPFYVIHTEFNSNIRSTYITDNPLFWFIVLVGICYLVHILVEKPFIKLGKRIFG